MYLLIEHSGTKEHNELSSKIQEIAESELGATCDFTIGDSTSTITLYDKNLKQLAEFSNPRTDDDITFILHFLLDGDNLENE